MMKTFLLAAASAVALAVAAPADAAQITGTLSLNGANSYSATQITFANPANVGARSGDFATVLANCTGCVTIDLNPLTFSPSLATGLLYTVTQGVGSGAVSSTFTITGGTGTVSGGGNLLTIIASGVATLTGYDPTPGTITLTSQGGVGTSVTFSSTTTATPVPEPATLALLGAGLVGLGIARRRRVAA